MIVNEHLFAFEKLKIWEEIRDLIKIIYSITKKYPKDELFGLVCQIRRAIISVASNVVEGTGRTSSKDQAHFYQLSYSSLLEVLSQIIISKDLNYIENDEYNQIRNKIEKISYLLNHLRKSVLSTQTKQNK